MVNLHCTRCNTSYYYAKCIHMKGYYIFVPQNNNLSKASLLHCCMLYTNIEFVMHGYSGCGKLTLQTGLKTI